MITIYRAHFLSSISLFYYEVFPSIYVLFIIFFFFSSRRRHTRLQGDWSSDVCSSDLGRSSQCSRKSIAPPRWGSHLMMSLSGAMSCWRYMPRFRRALCGPRVTVNPHVMRGPASSGQHVWIGRRARSASFPSQTTCWHGAPSARTLLSSPARSSSDRKSRRSRYLISLGDRCRVGTVERDSGPRDSPPSCKVGKNSDKKDRADPVVLVKSLEAGFSVATADEAIVMGHDRGRSGETQIVDETQPAVQADDCEQRERHAVADHYRKHIVSAEGDRGRFDADTQIVVAIHHSIFRIVGDRPEDVGKEQPPAFGRDGLEDCGVPHRNAEPERDSKIGLGNRQESFGQGIGRREAKRGK